MISGEADAMNKGSVGTPQTRVLCLGALFNVLFITMSFVGPRFVVGV